VQRYKPHHYQPKFFKVSFPNFSLFNNDQRTADFFWRRTAKIKPSYNSYQIFLVLCGSQRFSKPVGKCCEPKCVSKSGRKDTLLYGSRQTRLPFLLLKICKTRVPFFQHLLVSKSGGKDSLLVDTDKTPLHF